MGITFLGSEMPQIIMPDGSITFLADPPPTVTASASSGIITITRPGHGIRPDETVLILISDGDSVVASDMIVINSDTITVTNALDPTRVINIVGIESMGTILGPGGSGGDGNAGAPGHAGIGPGGGGGGGSSGGAGGFCKVKISSAYGLNQEWINPISESFVPDHITNTIECWGKGASGILNGGGGGEYRRSTLDLTVGHNYTIGPDAIFTDGATVLVAANNGLLRVGGTGGTGTIGYDGGDGGLGASPNGGGGGGGAGAGGPGLDGEDADLIEV